MATSFYSIFKVYTSSTDKFDSRLLYEYLVQKAKKEGLTGATVYRGIMGFGSSSKISSSKFWELTEKLPVVIEIIDTTEKLEKFYTSIEDILIKLPKGVLVTMEAITVKLQKPGKK